jgi:hypothetical protein
MLPEAPDAPEPSPVAALPDVEDPEFSWVPDDDPVCAVPSPLAAMEPVIEMLPLDEEGMEPDPTGGESLQASLPAVAPPVEPLEPLAFVII